MGSCQGEKRFCECSSLCVDVGVCAHCYVCACAGGGRISLVASPPEFSRKGLSLSPEISNLASRDGQ